METYICDDGSTDDTVAIAERWLGRGLLGIEEAERTPGHAFDLKAQLTRKEELARELEADWFIHLDPDEIRLPPARGQSLVEALEEADRASCNAVNFSEFTFLPTVEEPDHDHPRFQETLLTYYPHAPRPAHHVKAWKATEEIELAWSSGHEARFPGVRLYPRSFVMKHYLFLSVPHAVEKYVRTRPGRRKGSWRANLKESDVRLLSRSELRVAGPGAEMDASEPRARHYLAELAGTRF